MKRLGWVSVLILGVSVVGCAFLEDPHLAKGKVSVTYRGLIGYVEDANTVWALLADANYQSIPPDAKELPPFAELTHPGSIERVSTFPPHFSVLRVKVGSEKGKVFDLSGGDWRIVVEEAPSPVSLAGTFADGMKIIERLKDPPVKSGEISKYRELDRVWCEAVDPGDISGIISGGRLGARILIDRGELSTEEGASQYSFRDRDRKCKGKFGELVVTVTQVFDQRQGEVIFRDRVSGDEISIEDEGFGIEVLVQNEIYDAIRNPDTLGETHHEAFRWLYRLSEDPLSVGVERHAWPCVGFLLSGGTRCPQKKLTASHCKESEVSSFQEKQ